MNTDIKIEMKRRNVRQWAVAKACGVSETTMVRWLRDDLSEERKAAIYAAIDRLSEQRDDV